MSDADACWDDEREPTELEQELAAALERGEYATFDGGHWQGSVGSPIRVPLVDLLAPFPWPMRYLGKDKGDLIFKRMDVGQ